VTISALNFASDHPLFERIQTRTLPSGFSIIRIAGKHGTLEVSPEGAHVLNWTPRDGAPVFWVSEASRFEPGVPVRGGIPICWPWFGFHPVHKTLPGHGYARTTAWELAHAELRPDESIRCTFKLAPDDRIKTVFSCDVTAAYTITLGAALEIELTTTHHGGENFDFTTALHPYFAVSNVKQVTVHGLEATAYYDKIADQNGIQDGPVSVDKKIQRYYGHDGSVVIRDRGLRRAILIEKRNSGSTVVWNPAYEQAQDDFGDTGSTGMVCVEPAVTAQDNVTLSCGNVHSLYARYTVLPVNAEL
jgi:glucose-6-phosphate 1-epimerase